MEKMLLVVLTLTSLAVTITGFRRILRLIGIRRGDISFPLLWKRLISVGLKTLTFQPTFRSRFWVSLFHAVVGWGFFLYLFINIFDLVRAFGGRFFLPLTIWNGYLWLADIFSAAVLAAMLFFLVRRFVFRSAALRTRSSIWLLPQARRGIDRDSAIVAAFLIAHVGARLLGRSFSLALLQPMVSCCDIFATSKETVAVSLGRLWLDIGWGPESLVLAQHIAFWLSFGAILAFLPYFPFSKHVHLMFAPLNHLLKPPRRSMGEMGYLNLDDLSLERFGAETLANLGWEQRMDAFSCIMCFRCQEVCPPYQTGKPLSPAALEINKRYVLNAMRGENDLSACNLVEQVIPKEAIWACTACGACVDICPVGNEPMRDILDIRRAQALMTGDFPSVLDATFRNLERTGNPWGMPAHRRLVWADGLAVPTVEQNPEAEILWWVGCAASFDPQAQRVARSFAQILITAGVNFAVLGERESCTADMARRAGREDIFFKQARTNVEILNALTPKRIVTTCPHCLHVLKNEYPSFGGHYQVIHHAQLLLELMTAGKISLPFQTEARSFTFHDPCYLGRQNEVLAPPRDILRRTAFVEMPHHGRKSFCCGAGGAQMWKEEEKPRMNEIRLEEARATGCDTLVVACPFCLTMLTEAGKSFPDSPAVRDLAEVVADEMVGNPS